MFDIIFVNAHTKHYCLLVLTTTLLHHYCNFCIVAILKENNGCEGALETPLSKCFDIYHKHKSLMKLQNNL